MEKSTLLIETSILNDINILLRLCRNVYLSDENPIKKVAQLNSLNVNCFRT